MSAMRALNIHAKHAELARIVGAPAAKAIFLATWYLQLRGMSEEYEWIQSVPNFSEAISLDPDVRAAAHKHRYALASLADNQPQAEALEFVDYNDDKPALGQAAQLVSEAAGHLTLNQTQHFHTAIVPFFSKQGSTFFSQFAIGVRELRWRRDLEKRGLDLAKAYALRLQNWVDAYRFGSGSDRIMVATEIQLRVGDPSIVMPFLADIVDARGGTGRIAL